MLFSSRSTGQSNAHRFAAKLPASMPVAGLREQNLSVLLLLLSSRVAPLLKALYCLSTHSMSRQNVWAYLVLIPNSRLSTISGMKLSAATRVICSI